MVADGGIIDVMQPIQMADTTGVDNTAGTWQNTAQTTEWYGWTGRGPGIRWRRCPWRSGPTSHSNSSKNIDFYSSMCNNSFVLCHWNFLSYIVSNYQTGCECDFLENIFRINDIKIITLFSFFILHLYCSSRST